MDNHEVLTKQQPIIGAGALIAEQADLIGKVSDAESFLNTAKAMLDGAQPLQEVNPVPAIAVTFLCGFCAETALKAALAQTGTSTKVLKDIGHQLIQLWNEAVSKGILDSVPPRWLEQLNSLHAGDYVLRYPMQLNGIVLPNQAAMMQSCLDLYAAAKAIVR